MKIKDLKIFGLIWAAIFVGIGIYPVLFSNADVRVWAVVVSGVFLMISLIKPLLLTKFYKIWIKLGEFIGGIISKVILFVIFYTIFTPAAIFLKILKKDLLNKKMSKSDESYWINRDTQPQSMKKQF